jgi:hypothetical protein
VEARLVGLEGLLARTVERLSNDVGPAVAPGRLD